MFDRVNDSGERQEFETGSVRDTREGKGRFDLLPPYALKRLAQHYENGAKKYGDRNWEKGQNLSRYADSAIRHLYAFLGGARSEDHMAAVAWNALALIETEHRVAMSLLPAELDDLPYATPQTDVPNPLVDREFIPVGLELDDRVRINRTAAINTNGRLRP